MELPSPSPFLSERSPSPPREASEAAPEEAHSILGARGEHGGLREPGAEGPSPAPAFRAGWWREPESGARTASAGLGREGAGPLAPGGPEQASCRRVRWLRSSLAARAPRRAAGPWGRRGRTTPAGAARAGAAKRRPPQTKLTTWLPPPGKLLASCGAAGVPQLQVSLAWPPSRRPPAAAHPARGRAGKL